MNNTPFSRPLILSPAGSPEALYAALDNGADEIYFGLPSFNARIHARNFTKEEAREAFRTCRLRGVKTNVTLNTLVTDREMGDCVRAAYEALCDGADAFIVQDMGLAAVLKKAIPGIVLHASTQCACHSVSGAEMLAEAGFSRVVLARELGEEEIREITRLGMETEIFVHGALCVCHSGMCLMSSVIGKRSGNRGLCAQPCRLPCAVGEKGAVRDRHALSLKDMSLAYHVPSLLSLGVTSLKIEGRMKASAYVAQVTRTWKTLVCEGRNATAEEYRELEKQFSRSGFTDAYFTGEYRTDNRAMYGVRTEKDKEDSRESRAAGDVSRYAVKRSLTVEGDFAVGEKPTLVVSDGVTSVTVAGDKPLERAKASPLTEGDIAGALGKFGGTPFSCAGIQIHLTGEGFAARSELNALRRKAVSAMTEALLTWEHVTFDETALTLPQNAPTDEKSVPPRVRLFPYSVGTAEEMLKKTAGMQVEAICVPLSYFGTPVHELVTFAAERGLPLAVRLPRVVFSSEKAAAVALLKRAAQAGAVAVVADNIGHPALIREAGLAVWGGAGLNVFNSFAVRYFAEAGVKNVTLSPELLTAQMRDIRKESGVTTAVVGEGNPVLMVLESCVVKAQGACRKTADGGICAYLTDRTGARFPIRSEHRLNGTGYPCRNLVLNSIPVHLISKPEEIAKTHADVVCIYETVEIR